MQSWVAVIDVDDQQQAFVIKAADMETAVQRLHAHLVKQNPSVWSDDWRDLMYDSEEGNQMLYGPYDSIPVLN